MRSAIVSGIVTGVAPVRYRPILSPSLVEVPKVFAKINSAQFSSRVSRTHNYCGILSSFHTKETKDMYPSSGSLDRLTTVDF